MTSIDVKTVRSPVSGIKMSRITIKPCCEVLVAHVKGKKMSDITKVQNALEKKMGNCHFDVDSEMVVCGVCK